MEIEEIELLKEQLMEIDPCIVFDDKNEDKLIGYAERFGCQIIPLYENVNTFLFSDPEESISEAAKLSDKVCLFDDLKSSIVGYVIFGENHVAILHDKEVLLDNMSKEFEDSGMGIDEDDSYYSQAYQYYDYNVIGTGLSDMTTPAFACTEEWPLPVSNN